MAISDYIEFLGRSYPAFYFLMWGDMLYIEVLLFVRLNLVLIGLRVPWSSFSIAALNLVTRMSSSNFSSSSAYADILRTLNWWAEPSSSCNYLPSSLGLNSISTVSSARFLARGLRLLGSFLQTWWTSSYLGSYDPLLSPLSRRLASALSRFLFSITVNLSS